jgi:hypothetical protein
LAITHHLTRNESGGFDRATHETTPMEFVIAHIPDGTPFNIYIDEIGEDTDVTDDIEALQEDAVFYVVESPGGGVVKGVFSLVGKILSPILKLLSPSAATPEAPNQQGASPNNRLTDRTNKPRPYERTYDICGTVQSIPNDLMTVYRKFDTTGNIIEFGYYDVGRGPLDTSASGITDGDTRMSEIPGSSAAVYGPFTSPNSGAPQTLVGEPITEGLYVTASSNEVDGAELRAANDLTANVGDIATVSRIGSTATITDATGDSRFNDFMKPGDAIELLNIVVATGGGPFPPTVNLSGVYTVTAISSVDVAFTVDTTVPVLPAVNPWLAITAAQSAITPGADVTTGPYDKVGKSWSPWFTVDKIKATRVLANFGATGGMYKDDGGRKYSAQVAIRLEYQALDADGAPIGPVYAADGVVSGRSSDQTGVSVIGELPVASAVRARARRLTDKDLGFSGQVIDDVSFDNLYSQEPDLTPNYGNRTTVHTARRQTPRATSVKQPKLALIVTERLYKYLGNGVFDTALSNNTQAMQSLIRLLRDPVCGGLNLTTSNMDRLIAVQAEIETYFGNAAAGQFCYTFDSFDATMQDIIDIIAEAVFCRGYREGSSILLDFDRPRMGPEMVFTHRSKAPGEKWTRAFNTRDRYDSLKFSYIDPATNTKETITIPPDGGLKTDTYDSKGIRNYKQAYWAAYRRYQRNLLNRVSVDFAAMEEGIFARPGRAISVVKGSRVSPFDGYVVAVDGLTVVLSQNVEFTPGQDHSLVLKRRDGSVQSVEVTPGANARTVIMTSAPQEAIYTGNEALKTEFSFGSDDRHNGQMMVVSTVEPGSNRTVRITGYNYTDEYYAYDGVAPFGRAFSSGFSNGFS